MIRSSNAAIMKTLEVLGMPVSASMSAWRDRADAAAAAAAAPVA